MSATTPTVNPQDVEDFAESDGLPAHWQMIPLKNLTKPSSAKVDPTDYPKSPYLSLEHIEANTTKIVGAGLGEDVHSTKAAFRAGDVLYGRLRPYLNKVTIPNFNGISSTDILVFPPNEDLDQGYLMRFLNSATVVEYAHRHSMGLQMPRIGFEVLGEIEIPLPPIAEQREIVARIEELVEQVNSARERLASIPILLKRFRQSVLAAACSGQLTADWRGTENLIGWEDIPAQDVCGRVQSGSTPKEGFQGMPGIPFLKVYNLVDQRLDFDYKPQFVSESVYATKSMSRSTAIPGDVLMNIVGPPLGKVVIVSDQYPEWTFNQALTMFRPSTRITTEWLYVILCSGMPYEEILMQTRGSAGQSNISLTQCREMVLPVPPVDEQTEIVRRVDALFALADSIESRLTDATAQVERTTQAILAKAFRGELVQPGPCSPC
ncbi:MAG: restriction endonuclease subunit S [Armatimonadetes bacterium]|nr:restriction endonuclease subunit S [Armatimonadota bacterium]